MGSSIEYKYSLTQSTPGDYRYVKLWDSGPILQAEIMRKDESGNTQVALISAKPMFPAFLRIFGSLDFLSYGFRRSDHLPSEGDQKYRLCLDQPFLRLS